MDQVTVGNVKGDARCDKPIEDYHPNSAVLLSSTEPFCAFYVTVLAL